LKLCLRGGSYVLTVVVEFTNALTEMEDFVQCAEAKKMREKIYIFRKLRKWIEDQHEKNQFDFLDSPTQTSLAESKARKQILQDLADWIDNN
jgi:hypothetical protein